MGCCMSSSTKSPPKHSDLAPKTQSLSPEEETVKEVVVHSVSETPTTTKVPPEEHHGLREKTPETEVSQASEICDTLSQSFSTATTATRGEDEALSRPPLPLPLPQARKRPQASGPTTKRRCNGGGGARPDRVSRSPARRAEQSPPARTGLAKPSQVGPRKRSLGPAAAQRVPEEGRGFPRRRLRSPATRTSTTAGAKRIPAKGGGWAVDVDEREDGDEVEEQERESLENPLVSLECFIFL